LGASGSGTACDSSTGARLSAFRMPSKVSLGSMLSKKDFEGMVDARLIQSEHQTRKIDSRIQLV
jgi:hypothetical protein